MSDIITTSDVKDEIKIERPPLHKVILVNDDYMPREFVVTVLRLNSVRAKIKLCL